MTWPELSQEAENILDAHQHPNPQPCDVTDCFSLSMARNGPPVMGKAGEEHEPPLARRGSTSWLQAGAKQPNSL